MKFETRELDEVRTRKLNQLLRDFGLVGNIADQLASAVDAAGAAAASAQVAIDSADSADLAHAGAVQAFADAQGAFTAADTARSEAVAKALAASNAAADASAQALAALGYANISTAKATEAGVSASSASAWANLAYLRSVSSGSSANSSVVSAQAASVSSDAAGVYASAAQTSELNAATSEANASSSASAAATSASSASSSSTSAGSSASAAAASALAAAASNTSANTAATAANSSAVAANASAATASTQATLASTYAGNASTSATNASTSATNASSSASSASSSALLAASAGPGLRNKNPVFSVWSNSAAPPDGWGQAYGSAAWATRIAGDIGGYAYDVTVAAGQTHEIGYGEPAGSFSPGWYVIELEIEAVSGNWGGGAARLFMYDSGGTPLEGFWLDLENEAPIGFAAQGATPTPRRYSFRKLVQFTNTAGSLFYFGASGGGVMRAKAATGRTIIRRAGFRPATATEVRDQTVLAPMEASVSVLSSASAAHSATLTTLNAKYSVKVTAGKVVGFELNADGTTSDFIVQADKFKIENGTGIPFEVIGGTTYIKNAIIQDAAIITSKVADNAISNIVSAFTAGAVFVSSVTPVTLQTITITATGKPILLRGFVVFSTDATWTPGGVTVTIKRNGTSILSYEVVGPTSCTPTIIDTPSAGSVTYVIEAKATNLTPSVSASNRELDAMEVKK